MQLIINEYVNKTNQNLDHYIPISQAVRRTANLNFCNGSC